MKRGNNDLHKLLIGEVGLIGSLALFILFAPGSSPVFPKVKMKAFDQLLMIPK